MEQLLEIIKYILPSLVVFLVVYFLIKFYLFSEDKKRLIDLKMESRKLISPLRFQAYERLALFLERINPNNLLLRVSNSNLNVSQYQMLLHSSIRSEFEHNLSQQIYISIEAWESIKKAKEDVIKIINLSAGNIDVNGGANLLSTKIFETLVSYKKSPTDEALEVLKKELHAFY